MLTFNLEDKKAYKWSFDVLKMYAIRFSKDSQVTIKTNNPSKTIKIKCRAKTKHAENKQKLKTRMQKQKSGTTPPPDLNFSSSRWNQYGGGGGGGGGRGKGCLRRGWPMGKLGKTGVSLRIIWY